MKRRIDGRAPDEVRNVRIIPGYIEVAEGSALIELGRTRVLCTATVEERVPPFLKGRETGWVTAEYGMLPRSTPNRIARDITGKAAGRAYEIQRLIGRSLRAAVNLDDLGARTITIDCDVLQADGGTRTAAITGGFVALAQALKTMFNRGEINIIPIKFAVAAISVGIVGGVRLVDLCYEEDSQADVDFNVVMSEKGDFIEIQGTAERKPFSKQILDSLLELAWKGIEKMLEAQQEALARLGL